MRMERLSLGKRTRGYTFEPVRFDVALCAPAQVETSNR